MFSIGKDKTRVGMLSYSTKPLMLNDIYDPKYFNANELIKLAQTFRYWGGGTRTDLALEKANERFYGSEKADRPNDKYPNVLLVLTDGNTSSKSKPYAEVLKPLRVNLKSSSVECCLIIAIFAFCFVEIQIEGEKTHIVKKNITFLSLMSLFFHSIYILVNIECLLFVSPYVYL